MPQMLLRQKLQELCKSASTLLWLEGAKHDRVLGVSLQGGRLILELDGGTTRMVAFEKFAITTVGLQFWSAGRPGVLYKWEQVPKSTFAPNNSADDGNDDDGQEPPPGMAA